jgi:hypothetical protein
VTYPYDPNQQPTNQPPPPPPPNMIVPMYPPQSAPPHQPWSPQQHPLPPQWTPVPPPPPYGQYQQQAAPAEQEKAGLFRAGKVALWVWVVVTLAPILIIGLCCAACFATGMAGTLGGSTSGSP